MRLRLPLLAMIAAGYVSLAGCVINPAPHTKGGTPLNAYSDHTVAMSIIDYGLSHRYGTDDRVFATPQYVVGAEYCFDCDMKQRRVPKNVLREWHEVMFTQLTENRPGDGLVDHSIYEVANGNYAGGRPNDWSVYTDRVVAALSARPDFKQYVGTAEAANVIHRGMDSIYIHTRRCMTSYDSCY